MTGFRPAPRHRHAVLVLAAFVLGLAVSRLLMDSPSSRESRSALTVLTGGPRLPDFRLTDQDGGEFGPAALRGRWTLLFTGFASCGDVCPDTMARLNLVVERLGQERVGVVFLSVDPGRDSPDVLRAWVRAFNPRFTGVTGDRAEIDTLTGALGVPYFVDRSDGRYVVDHSSSVFLIGPRPSLAGVMSASHSIDDMVADLDRFLNDQS